MPRSQTSAVIEADQRVIPCLNGEVKVVGKLLGHQGD